MISNCFIWAHLRERELYREWVAKGKPIDRVPIILRRPSRLAPTIVGHWLVGWWEFKTARVTDIESFVPNDKSELSWWQLFKVVIFKGHIKHGDSASDLHA